MRAGAGKLWGDGTITRQRRFVRSDDSIFPADVPAQTRRRLSARCTGSIVQRSLRLSGWHAAAQFQCEHAHIRALMRFLPRRSALLRYESFECIYRLIELAGIID